GRSELTDGYGRGLEFQVAGKVSGGTLELERPGEVTVRAKVAAAPEMPLGVAYGEGPAPRLSGDTVTLHGPLSDPDARKPGGKRRFELGVNGTVAAGQEEPAARA